MLEEHGATIHKQGADMAATIEAPAMTLRQAEDAVIASQSALASAQQALQQHEHEIGAIALRDGVDAATEAMLRLQISVKRAEAALQAALSQRQQVRLAAEAQRIVDLRSMAKKLDARLTEDSLFLKEWGPKVAAAQSNFELGAKRFMLLERQIEEHEARLNEKLKQGGNNGR
jgi:predicted  nucleic acid-binding Zn-ribbon protein